jgi:hypothetical protein
MGQKMLYCNHAMGGGEASQKRESFCSDINIEDIYSTTFRPLPLRNCLLVNYGPCYIARHAEAIPYQFPRSRQDADSVMAVIQRRKTNYVEDSNLTSTFQHTSLLNKMENVRVTYYFGAFA